MIKKVTITSLVLTLILVSSNVVYAINASPSGMKTAATQNAITILKQKADAEITRRINSINELMARINNMKRLADTDKTNLQNEANEMIGNLNALKTKIDNEEDLSTLRKDRQDIFTQYRIYMLFMPQLRIYVAADRVLDTVDLMQKVHDKLLSTAATDAQKNSLADAQNKLNDASSKAKEATDVIKDLKPDEGNQGIASSNRQALLNAKSLLMQAVSDLQVARKDFVQVRNSLPTPTP